MVEWHSVFCGFVYDGIVIPILFEITKSVFVLGKITAALTIASAIHLIANLHVVVSFSMIILEMCVYANIAQNYASPYNNVFRAINMPVYS